VVPGSLVVSARRVAITLPVPACALSRGPWPTPSSCELTHRTFCISYFPIIINSARLSLDEGRLKCCWRSTMLRLDALAFPFPAEPARFLHMRLIGAVASLSQPHLNPTPVPLPLTSKSLPRSPRSPLRSTILKFCHRERWKSNLPGTLTPWL
jgi:hypothetical protein